MFSILICELIPSNRFDLIRCLQLFVMLGRLFTAYFNNSTLILRYLWHSSMRDVDWRIFREIVCWFYFTHSRFDEIIHLFHVLTDLLRCYLLRKPLLLLMPNLLYQILQYFKNLFKNTVSYTWTKLQVFFLFYPFPFHVRALQECWLPWLIEESWHLTWWASTSVKTKPFLNPRFSFKKS